MQIFDLPHDEDGVVAFEVSSRLLTRAGACAIARAIPGATMIHEDVGDESSPGEDDFCEFDLAGVRFLISRQYGVGRYWIGPQPVRRIPQIEVVRAAFERSTWLNRILGRAG
jgi:hypothetical protein